MAVFKWNWYLIVQRMCLRATTLIYSFRPHAVAQIRLWMMMPCYSFRLFVFFFALFAVHPLIQVRSMSFIESVFVSINLLFCPPQVPNQLVGAPLLTDVTIICNVEASPKAINYWQRENGKIMNRKIFNFSFFSMVFIEI